MDAKRSEPWVSGCREGGPLAGQGSVVWISHAETYSGWREGLKRENIE